jgi:hypothetical protein
MNQFNSTINQQHQFNQMNHQLSFNQISRQFSDIDLQFDDYEQFYIPIEGYGMYFIAFHDYEN